jgi:hypothetical protein
MLHARKMKEPFSVLLYAGAGGVQGSEIRGQGSEIVVDRRGMDGSGIWCRGFRTAVTFPLVKEGLENEGGGYLIDYTAVLLAGVARLIENLMGLAGGQALVPQVDGEAGELAEFCGKCLGSSGLRAGFAGQVHRITHYDAGHGKPSSQPREGAEVVP